MKMLVRFLLALLVVKAAVASPRFSRQAELDTYDDTNYDVDIENIDLENQDIYDYEDSLNENPEIEIGTLPPPDYSYPVQEGSLEEEQEVLEHEEELPLKPQQTPQGSGDSGVLMGPNTQKEEELRLTPIDTLLVSGDFGGSCLGPLGLGLQETQGLLLLGARWALETLSPAPEVLGTSLPLPDQGISLNLGISLAQPWGPVAPEPLGTLVLEVREIPRALGISPWALEYQGTSSWPLGALEISLLVLGVQGMFPCTHGPLGISSWALEDQGTFSWTLGALEIFSWALGVQGMVSWALGDQGISLVQEISGDHQVSGASGGSGESGDLEITLISGGEELIPDTTIPQEASGSSGEMSGSSGAASGGSGDFEGSGTSGASGSSGASGDSGSGDTEEPEVKLIPQIDEEEELLPIKPETPQEGTGGTEGSAVTELPEPETTVGPVTTVEPEEPVVDRTGMPTCLLCTCLGTSVYCDDLKLDSIPPLPKETTHFYARYNRLTKINKSDFAFMNKLKRIDVTSNDISSIDEKAFSALPALEELVIRENHVSQLPALPATMTLIDASHNNVGTRGIHKEAFKDMAGLLYLYLTDNHLDYIPVPLPDSLRALHLQRNNIQSMHEDTFCNLQDFNYIRNALEDIRLDGNPVNLSRTPQAYICLPRIPVGTLI
ncbi:Epiphycan [Merluccius polli]|uniref:Epiphycan n=1 Tax=Merluccius polli TaxID=89951 RepID=A0AA47MMH9_MERPO|nr:Epiphycan [Merluccius polli]